MARIESNVAAHVGDHTRPLQSQVDAQQQQQEVVSERVRGEAPPSDVNSEDLRAVTENMKRVVELASSHQVGFIVDQSNKDILVEITDRESGELIKKLPSEEVLKLRHHLEEVIGMFLDETA